MKKMRKPSEVPASLKTINVKSILRKRGVYVQQRAYNDVKEAIKPLARKMLKKQKEVQQDAVPSRKYASFSDADALTYWEKQVHKIDIVEHKFELRVQQFVMKIVGSFASQLESELGEKKSFKKALKEYSVKGYFDDNEDDLLATAQLDFTPLLTDLAVIAGQEAMNLVTDKEVYLADLLRKKIAENVNHFTKSMLETDRERLIKLIADGIANGSSINDIRDAINRDFAEYSKMQAERITKTEVARVSNQAALDAWEQSGVVEGKQWITYGADDDCSNFDGQVVSLKGNFYGDTDEFADGDPPLHPNCRCGTIPVLVDE